ncbi:MAG: hypothetical protein KJO65_04780 [Gemmatimonadetes bacterium]|nr:hypothetical protein [Gemmatimonadota bacterium]
MMRGVIRGLLILAALPVCVIVGALVASFFTGGYSSEDAAEPSGMATVMAVWEFDGGSLCRAFTLRDLLPHRDSLALRFALTPADVERCRADFASYDRREGWPRTLPGRDLAYEAYGFEIESPAPELRVVVHRSSGDVTFTRTRYRVDASGRLTDVETRGAGPGAGLGPVMGGFLGIVFWLCGAAWVGWRWRTGPLGPTETP